MNAAALFKLLQPARELSFEEPYLVIQSDDWGRHGLRGADAVEQLTAHIPDFGSDPYDLYAGETERDLHRLRDTLQKHRDSAGRHPVVVANFLTSQTDCEATLQNEHSLVTRPLNTHPLLPIYRNMCETGAFYPALHGLTHFNRTAYERLLSADSDQGRILRMLLKQNCPYILRLTPDIGFEFQATARSDGTFEGPAQQRAAVNNAIENFTDAFGRMPESVCAPGYRANDDTFRAWREAGLRVAQRGAGSDALPTVMRQNGLLQLQRTIEFEPALRASSLENLVTRIREGFAGGCPAIICTHAINFHSGHRNELEKTLSILSDLLNRLIVEFPALRYIHDGDLLEMTAPRTVNSPDSHCRSRTFIPLLRFLKHRRRRSH